MKQLKQADEKQKISDELRELTKKINEIMDSAPLYLDIRFTQIPGTYQGKNAHLCVFVSETISYV